MIGTCSKLLGVKEKECVRGAQCLLCPSQQDELEVAIDMVYEQEMFGLHRRVAPNEVILGW